MKNDCGYLSIDFLAGFTIFMVAFIWVATLIPGLFLDVKGNAIDYDAVAYRTGVILVEDPGWQVDGTSEWENIDDLRVDMEVTRIGYAMAKESPGILSAQKINRSFCSTAFSYPASYQSKVIFGDHPYQFNISVLTNGTFYESVGPVCPEGAYGYIRRFAKVKVMSNSTIDAYTKMSVEQRPFHIFSPELNMTDLILKENRVAYQINPRKESTAINITNISSIYTNQSNINYFGTPASGNLKVYLLEVNITRLNPSEPLVTVPPEFREVYVDGVLVTPKPTVAGRKLVTDNLSIMFNSSFFGTTGMTTTASRVFVNFTFGLYNTSNATYDAGYCLSSTQCDPSNPTVCNPAFSYVYGSPYVTEPRLVPAVVEVAVW